MQLFNFDETPTPTKLFVSQLTEPQEKETTVVEKSLMPSTLGSMLISVAPDLVDQATQAISKAIAGFAKDHVTTTLVQKNIDAHSQDKIFLPKTLTLIRGQFANHLQDSDQGEIFGDGENQSINQVKLISNKELHIEIDIIPSQNGEAIYFQPRLYYYQGEDIEGNSIDELTLAFAFIPAGESISAYEQLTYQSIIHFKQLENHQTYNFQSTTGYDTTYQSPWIIPHLSRTGPYTLVVGIQEIRKGNSFAKLLQEMYEKHDDQLNNMVKSEVLKIIQEHKSETLNK